MIYKLGSKSDDVEKIQTRLKGLGYLQEEVSGIYGTTTRAAVTTFQRDLDINADGIVGVVTWAKLFPIERPAHPLLFVPESREQLYELFGDPLTAGYWEAYGGFCETPPELNHVFSSTWNGKNGFWCNKLLAQIFQRAYAQIVKEGLAGELYSFDGCYCVRNVRGGDQLSMHSWGIAIDHNAKTNRLGSKGDMHPKVVAIFEAEEFTYGGKFRRSDPMHFEFTKAGL